MSIELETCDKCGDTFIFSLDKHFCKTRKERDQDLQRRWDMEKERGRPLSADQAYHLFNLED